MLEDRLAFPASDDAVAKVIEMQEDYSEETCDMLKFFLKYHTFSREFLLKCMNTAKFYDFNIAKMLMKILVIITTDEWTLWDPQEISSHTYYLVVDNPQEFFTMLVQHECQISLLKSYFNSSIHDEDTKNKLARIYANHVLK